MKWVIVVSLLLVLTACSSGYYLDWQEDPYLTYTYPDEDLPYDLTYRKIDFYTNMILLHELYDVPVENADVMHEQLSSFLQWSLTTSFHNTKKQFTSDEVVALDTFCIVGWLYESDEAAYHVMKYIPDDYNIMEDDYYTVNFWRNFADESWCGMLLARTNVDPSLSEDFLDAKLEDAEAFIDGEYSKEEKAAVTMHVLLLLIEYEGRASEKELWISRAYPYLDDEELAVNTLLMANMVDALLSLDVPPEDVESYITIMKEREEGGIWLPRIDAEPGYGHIFSTPRVKLALEHYESKTN